MPNEEKDKDPEPKEEKCHCDGRIEKGFNVVHCDDCRLFQTSKPISDSAPLFSPPHNPPLHPKMYEDYHSEPKEEWEKSLKDIWFRNRGETDHMLNLLESFISQNFVLREKIEEVIEEIRPAKPYPNANNNYQKELDEEDKMIDKILSDLKECLLK